MKYKIFAFSLSGIIIIFGIINITKGKGLNPGIDFAGGSLVRLMLKTQVPIDEVRKSLSDAGLGSPRIQEIGNTKREYFHIVIIFDTLTCQNGLVKYFFLTDLHFYFIMYLYFKRLHLSKDVGWGIGVKNLSKALKKWEEW